ncbi:MAG TPA: isoprenylcysteine carboxylmethyltransferase family protein [Casimicrobiaceae bacterium]|nr:isoprenylcysteine carboxylmethyltransferase family protein [Casimicrobiaceae bacterium]
MLDLPSLALALVLWFYWGQVGAMAMRIRRRTRTLRGVVPEQRIERWLGACFVPLVAAWLTFPLAAAWRMHGWLGIPDAARDGPWLAVRWLAALAAVALLIVTRRCWKRMGTQWKMAVTPGERQTLITDGPFANVRHPIYGYQILLMLASLAVVPTGPMLVLAVVHAILMTVKARNEERHLLGSHGDDYARYVARTGRFFPRFSR